MQRYTAALCFVLIISNSYCWRRKYHTAKRKINPLLRTFDYIDPTVAEDAELSTRGLLKKYGYPVKSFTVRTEDGYDLKIFRVPRVRKTPVLLVHGLVCSSDVWVMMGPEKGLAFMLYRAGYDVWLLNTRGNIYSSDNSDDFDDEEYWDFSFHEIGVYDLPATIDFIIKKTGFQKINYIGHSQGTTAFWAMCSERPEYAQKISLMQALAPVAFLGHCKSPIVQLISEFSGPISLFLELFGVYEIEPASDLFKYIKNFVCSNLPFADVICATFDFLIFGFNWSQYNETIAPLIIGHSMQGGSVKQLQHFGQSLDSDEFNQFDYGLLDNLVQYSSVDPPAYKLKNVRCKVALHYGRNDYLAALKDVAKLRKSLPNVVLDHKISHPYFNHMDFIYANDVVRLVNNKVINLLEKSRMHSRRAHRSKIKK